MRFLLFVVARDGKATANTFTSTYSYEHNNIDEPAILLGGAFTVGDDELAKA